jgi:hypothetical protein
MLANPLSAHGDSRSLDGLLGFSVIRGTDLFQLFEIDSYKLDEAELFGLLEK